MKDNVTATILEMGFLIATFLVPCFVEKAQEGIMADMFVYILMASSLVMSIVSFYYAIKAFREKCKGGQNAEPVQVTEEGDADPRGENIEGDALPTEEEGGHNGTEMAFRQTCGRIKNYC